ncbi:MAG: thiamine pyrophosphate-dependent enzyme [Polyangiaceae bacterium]
MSLERLQKIIARFRADIALLTSEERRELPYPRETLIELLESMLRARYLDLAAHELRASGHGHYTICSTGHECNAVVGRLTRPTDPAIVHYRSAAFQLERARQVAGTKAVRDIVLSLVASSEEPTSGGRHKVFGGKPLGMIPSTSTIASHVPRAMGLAFAIERRARLKGVDPGARDAIAVCSFGDASLNHSTALGAINAAGWGVHQGLAAPLLLVCEDNGIGISTRTPEGWVAARLQAEPHVRYFHAEGWDLLSTFATAHAAVDFVRSARRPAVLHLECVRLLGHAGSDADTAYRTQAEIDVAVDRDPVLTAAVDLVHAGAIDARAVLALDAKIAAEVKEEAERAKKSPRITSRAEVMSALTTPIDAAKLAASWRGANDAKSDGAEKSAEKGAPLTLAQGINAALAEALERIPGALLFGEDVAKKGGVYGVTKGLLAKFGAHRVFNTLLDEQSIFGIALGAATLGLLPIPEIQYLAYLHNAEDQVRGEASTMQFFSQRAYDNPMVVRIAGLGYQKGFGGHFHNDDSLAVLRDIPGIVVAVPARGDDAVEIYRSAFALAEQARRVVVVIEPIALYHTKDLVDGDSAWLAPTPSGAAEFGKARVYREKSADLVIATYGNGLWMSLRAAARLEREHGIAARVLDLRFIAPLPVEDVVAHARAVGKLLVVDECRRSGNVSEALAAAVLDANVGCRFRRVTSADSFIPLGDAANLVLLSEEEIFEAARELARS